MPLVQAMLAIASSRRRWIAKMPGQAGPGQTQKRNGRPVVADPVGRINEFRMSLFFMKVFWNLKTSCRKDVSPVPCEFSLLSHRFLELFIECPLQSIHYFAMNCFKQYFSARMLGNKRTTVVPFGLHPVKKIAILREASA